MQTVFEPVEPVVLDSVPNCQMSLFAFLQYIMYDNKLHNQILPDVSLGHVKEEEGNRCLEGMLWPLAT